MKPHPRIRKTIKWGGAAVTVLLVVVWIGSGWFSRAWWFPSGTSLGLEGGAIFCVHPDASLYMSRDECKELEAIANRRTSFRLSWRPQAQRGQHAWLIICPIYCAILTAALPAALAWRLDTLARRRARIGRCPKCNYDRAGIAADAKCPECGTLKA